MVEPSLGLRKTTLVDYPGVVAATVFTAGCNLRCPFCHNPELVTGPPPDDFLPVSQILSFLERRRSVIGGVCITGGEPLLHPWLPDFASRARSLGLKVKLDTNGMLPERIQAVGAHFIAMDIKTAPSRYSLVGGDRVEGSDPTANLRRSISIIREIAPEYEYRTTVTPRIVSEEDVIAIVALLKPGERFTLAAFRPGNTLDPAFTNELPPTLALLERYAKIASDRGLDVRIRENGVGGSQQMAKWSV